MGNWKIENIGSRVEERKLALVERKTRNERAPLPLASFLLDPILSSVTKRVACGGG